MVDIRLLNKGQGHSFWYQSISYMRLLIGSRTHCLAVLATIYRRRRQTDRRNTAA